eukprot:gnl/TRDRNA2_/TRDRNA2_164049_c1_seq3.p1 gnl/TRDRNA2_/TRDRNA2_164049_c1~~gnl/TRDRNA2_/TRDRNA2_164049_c1_seq3.p1  ORF type:complete len:164 (-),score=11.04 gnl/TRDRNA2_/TRDRNA2_164049_c1_seq3:61-552(-)
MLGQSNLLVSCNAICTIATLRLVTKLRASHQISHDLCARHTAEASRAPREAQILEPAISQRKMHLEMQRVSSVHRLLQLIPLCLFFLPARLLRGGCETMAVLMALCRSFQRSIWFCRRTGGLEEIPFVRSFAFHFFLVDFCFGYLCPQEEKMLHHFIMPCSYC